MINENKIKIGLIVVMLLSLFTVDVLKLNTGIKNLKEYMSAIKTVKLYNEEVDNMVNETSKVKQELSSKRGANAVDLEDVNDLYAAATGIAGVKEHNGKLLRFNGSDLKVLGDYVAADGDKNNNADGVQILVKVEDINAYLTELNKLKTPYVSLNVIYSGKEVVITYNTKGGQA